MLQGTQSGRSSLPDILWLSLLRRRRQGGSMPVAIPCDERIYFFRSPAAPPVGNRWMVILKHRLDNRPGGIHGILTGKEHAVAGHGIFQKPLVGQSLATF